MDLPVSLSSEDLCIYNFIRQSLAPDDRQVMDEMIASTRSHWSALKASGVYLTYEAFLLVLVMVKAKEICGLRT